MRATSWSSPTSGSACVFSRCSTTTEGASGRRSVLLGTRLDWAGATTAAGGDGFRERTSRFQLIVRCDVFGGLIHEDDVAA